MASYNDLSEFEEQLIARYTGSLKLLMREKIPLHTIFTLDDVVKMVEQIKEAVGKASGFISTSGPMAKESSSFNQTGAANNKGNGPLLETPVEKPTAPVDQYATQSNIKCYRC